MAGGKLISTGVEFPDATTQTTSGLPLTGGALTGAVTTTSTFDGRDVAADGVTADAALPKAGGTMTGDVSLGDNVKAKFGASDDLQIYHDGSNSIIADEGTGNLELHGASQVVLKHPTTGGDYVVCTGNGAVDLYHANALKLATTSTGVDVTGSVTCDGFTSTGIDDNATSTAITIDASENVLVGTTQNNPTSSGVNVAGQEFSTTGGVRSTVASNAAATFNRKTDDGGIVLFRKDGTTVGSIGSGEFSIYGVGANNTGWMFADGSAVLPMKNSALSDNLVDLGSASYRMDDIYATNGTIQTSDEREKQDIQALTTAESNVATACKGLLRSFRWKDSVAEKGDDARIHFGIIAQDLQDAFAAEGLDAGRYAMFISSTWYEKEVEVPAVEAVEAVEATYDDEGAELTPAVEAVEAKDAYTRTYTEDEPTDGYTERTRLGVRYPELLAFIISAI